MSQPHTCVIIFIKHGMLVLGDTGANLLSAIAMIINTGRNLAVRVTLRQGRSQTARHQGHSQVMVVTAPEIPDTGQSQIVRNQIALRQGQPLHQDHNRRQGQPLHQDHNRRQGPTLHQDHNRVMVVIRAKDLELIRVQGRSRVMAAIAPVMKDRAVVIVARKTYKKEKPCIYQIQGFSFL
jgi:hypothetical protein